MLETVVGIITPRLEIVGAVGDGKSALAQVVQTAPDVVLTDISMPVMDGIRMARALKQRGSAAKIVFLTGEEDDDYISEALNVGAHGYVIKRRMHSDLLPALDLALAQQYFISPHKFSAAPEPTSDTHHLGFYSDESTFFHRVAEVARTALLNGERVFLFLSHLGLDFVRKSLLSARVDLVGAMARKQCVALCVENVIPLLTLCGRGDREAFEVFFGRSLERAAACAASEGSRFTVFSDLLATLLKQGHDHSVASRIENIWNDLVSRHAFTVYC